MDKLERLFNTVRDYLGFAIVGGIVLLVGFVFFSRPGSGADPSIVQQTQVAVAIQRDSTVSADAIRLTQTPADIALTQSSPTLSLLGRQEIRQFAAAAQADTSLTDFDWAPFQAAGPPNVEGCQSSPQAWATQNATASITFSFAELVRPTRFRLYESFNPNFVSRIVITDVYGETYTIYQQTPGSVPTCPFILDVDVPLGGTFPANRVTVFIDQSTSAGGFLQIDAAELIGIRY